MTKVKLLTPAGGHDAGTTIDVTPGAAEHLIASGAAEATKTSARGRKASDSDSGDEVGGDSPSPS